MDDREIEVRFLVGVCDFSLVYGFKIGSRFHLASYIIGVVGFPLAGESDWSVKLNIHLHLVLMFGMVKLYLRPSIRFQDVVLNCYLTFGNLALSLLKCLLRSAFVSICFTIVHCVVYSGKASGCPVCESVDKQSCKVTLQHVL
jgi:hypothetical protein